MMNAEKQLKTMNIIFTIAGGLWAVWTVYLIVRNIKHPKVEIKSVNYPKGQAVIMHRGKEIMLEKNSIITAGDDGSDWGVKFNGPDENTVNRIELVNKDIVYQTLHRAA
jgi:hypothetical protein